MSEASEEGGPAESWELGVGDSAGPYLLKTSAAVGLLGGPTQTPLPGYDNLAGPALTIYEGLSRVSTEKIQSGVTDLVAACQEHNLPTGGLDTSTEGRIAYACTLATNAQDSGVPPEDWVIGGIRVGGQATPSASASASADDQNALIGNQVAGTASLLGALLGWQAPGHQDLDEAAAQLWRGLAVLKVDQVKEALDQVVQLCDQT